MIPDISLTSRVIDSPCKLITLEKCFYTFLLLKEHDQKAYEALVSFGERYTAARG